VLAQQFSRRALVPSYNDFLDSAKGRLLAYRKRKKRVFEFWWHGKLQSKKSASAQINQQFQNELIKQVGVYRRRGPFTGSQKDRR
jgi:hypothetical protein